MSASIPFSDWIVLALVLGPLLILAPLLGKYIAFAMEGRLKRIEAFFCKALALDPAQEQSAKDYTLSALVFSLASFAVTFILLLFQGSLPLLGEGKANLSPDLAFNIAVSFLTNTNWQSYAGEQVLTRFSQSFVLTTQNFLSAAAGLGVLMAFFRGLARAKAETVGSFWLDILRAVLFVLLPLSILAAIFYVSQGVVQTYLPSIGIQWIDPLMLAHADQQTVPTGFVASQTAIQMLGTNGGGFYNANMAHPFANPTPLSGLVSLIFILLIPVSLCFTFGDVVKDKRQGVMVLIVMAALLLPFAFLAVTQEYDLPLSFKDLAIATPFHGNMEGKEMRFGPFLSSLWSVFTTAASNGSANASFDSAMPLAGMASLALIQLGEIAFGGIGTGLAGLLAYAILAVFVAGLMVGRTPEFLGKKIGVFEMKMVALIVLIPPMATLSGAALTQILGLAPNAALAETSHNFTRLLYAFSSAAHNNGSAFSGLNANTPFFNIALGIAMLAGRYGVLLPLLALAGSLAGKPVLPESKGSLSTVDPVYVVFLIGLILLTAILTFVPALALGPVSEHLHMLEG